MPADFFVHPTSEVSPQAKIGHGTKIWLHCQVRENAEIGTNCILSKGVYVDAGVKIENIDKIQNSISWGLTSERENQRHFGLIFCLPSSREVWNGPS